MGLLFVCLYVLLFGFFGVLVCVGLAWFGLDWCGLVWFGVILFRTVSRKPTFRSANLKKLTSMLPCVIDPPTTTVSSTLNHRLSTINLQ